MKKSIRHTASLIPAIVFLVLSTFTNATIHAQSSKSQTQVVDSKTKQRTKTIEIVEVKGVKTVTVTTQNKDQRTVVIYTGEEADNFLEKHNQTVVLNDQRMPLEEMETMQFSLNVSGMEKGDSKSVLVIKDVSLGEEKEEIFVWNEFDERSLEMKDLDLKITDGQDGQPMKISMKFTNEYGKPEEKTMLISTTEIAKTLDDVQELFNELVIDVDIQTELDEENSLDEKTLIIRKETHLKEDNERISEQANSKMFKEIKVTTNLSRGTLQLKFEPEQEGSVSIKVISVDGMELFSDAYNGKGTYSQNIPLNDYQGVVIVTIQQGNNVDIQKLIVE